jgi:Leucine-rich repeat (LRR) protein
MEIKFESFGGNRYCCHITSLTAKEKNYTLPAINPALYLENRTNSNFTSLNISDSEMHFLPQNLSSTFPNFKFLNIDGAQLKEISKNDLKGLPRLTQLTITNCDLQSLPSDLFVYARKLSWINFSNNKIKHIGKHLLAPLNLDEVETIDLAENSTIDALFAWEDYKPLAKHVSIQQLKQIIADECQKKNEAEPVSHLLVDLWSSKMLCDFNFSFNDGRSIIPVHKNLLAVQSPVFAAMFQNQMKESLTSECKIEDISCETFIQFLEYLYTRKMPTATDRAIKLYSTAMKYQVQKLPELLEEMILDGINGDNALEILKLGNSFDNELLKICAFNEIKKQLTIEIPEDMIDSPDLIEELLIANQRMKKKHVDVDNEFKNKCDAILKKHRIK